MLEAPTFSPGETSPGQVERASHTLKQWSRVTAKYKENPPPEGGEEVESGHLAHRGQSSPQLSPVSNASAMVYLVMEPHAVF